MFDERRRTEQHSRFTLAAQFYAIIIRFECKFSENKRMQQMSMLQIINIFSVQFSPNPAGASSSAHLCDSLTHLSGAAVPLLGLGSHETLEDEVKRLRQRLHTVETENNALNSKLSQQQWELDNRLTEIEMHLCVPSPTAHSSESSCDAAELEEIEDLERNRESII